MTTRAIDLWLVSEGEARLAKEKESESEDEDYECEECGIRVIAAEIPEDESWCIAYGCLSMAFCKPCYERSWAEHPENPANPEEYGEDEGEYDCGCYYKHIPDAPFMCDKNGADYQYHDKNGCRTGSRILYKKDEDGDWCENYVCLSCVDDWKEQGAREEDEMSDDAVWREG